MKSKKNFWSNQLTGMLFAASWIIGLLVFYAYPLLSSIYYSFTDFNGISAPNFVGFDNFFELFKDVDDTFWISVKNTLFYTVFAVPIGLILGLSLALVLNIKTKLQGVFRAIAYLPTLVPAVAAGIVWQWLFNTQYGLINDFLMKLGFPMIAWLDDPALTKPTLILIAQWGVGSGLLVFLAGLQDVPKVFYEAATLDGAGTWKKFRYVTFPLITPVIFFQLVTGMIGALQQFTLPFLIGGNNGGVENSMLFYNMKLYNYAFSEFSMGRANAMAWIMFIFAVIITAAIYKTSGKWVHYLDGE